MSIDPSILKKHHQEYAARSNEKVGRRVKIKRAILAKILKVTEYKTSSDPIKIAVLGVSDKRYVKHHKRLFEEALMKDVEMRTFDIVTDHLKGEENIVQHDVTKPLPGGPFDIVLAHALLKFIEVEKQWQVIKNSYDALGKPGLVMHIFHRAEFRDTSQLKEWQYAVPIERWVKKLEEEKIKFKRLDWEILGAEKEPEPTTVLVLQK